MQSQTGVQTSGKTWKFLVCVYLIIHKHSFLVSIEKLCHFFWAWPLWVMPVSQESICFGILIRLWPSEKSIHSGLHSRRASSTPYRGGGWYSPCEGYGIYLKCHTMSTGEVYEVWRCLIYRFSERDVPVTLCFMDCCHLRRWCTRIEMRRQVRGHGNISGKWPE